MNYDHTLTPGETFTSQWFNADTAKAISMALATDYQLSVTVLSSPNPDGTVVITNSTFGLGNGVTSISAFTPLIPYYQVVLENQDLGNASHVRIRTFESAVFNAPDTMQIGLSITDPISVTVGQIDANIINVVTLSQNSAVLVTGAVTLSLNSTVSVHGTVSLLNNSVTILGPATVTGSVTLFGATVTLAASSVSVFGPTTVTGSVTLFNTSVSLFGANSVSVFGAATVTGNVGLANASVSIYGGPTVSVFGNATVTGSVSLFNTSVSLFGATSVSVFGAATVTGSVSLFNTSVSLFGANSVSVFGAATVTGSVSLFNTSVTLFGATSVSVFGPATVTGSVSLFNTSVSLFGANSVSVFGAATVTGSVSHFGNQTVTGSVSLFNTSVSLFGANSVSVFGAATVTGSVSLFNTSVSLFGANSVSVFGPATVTGSVTLWGSTVTLVNATVTVGALVTLSQDSTVTVRGQVTLSGNSSVSVFGVVTISTNTLYVTVTNFPSTGFGELAVETVHPVVQEHFAYGTYRTRMLLNGSGGATVSFANQAVVLVGTNTTCTAHAVHAIPVSYRAGKSSRARFTLKPNNISAGYVARGGLIGDGGCIGVGWSNTVFGAFYQRNMERAIWALSITSSAVGATATLTLNGTSTVFTVAQSYTGAVGAAAYIKTLPIENMELGWNLFPISNTVVFVSNDAYNPTGTFTLSHGSGQIAGTFSVIAAGTQASTDGFIPQSSFNIDRLDGSGASGFSLSTASYNVYELVMQYLGAGNGFFAVENPATGKFMTFHQVINSNFVTTSNFYSPDFRVGYQITNYSTGTALMSISGLCVAGFVDGDVSFTANRFGYGAKALISNGANNTTTITQTFTNLFSLRAREFVSTKSVLAAFRVEDLTIQSQGAAGAAFDVVLIRNGTLSVSAGPPNWLVVDPQSVVDVNTVSSTITGRIVRMFSGWPGGGAVHYDLQQMSITVGSRDFLSVAVRSSISGLSVTVNLNWAENF